MRPTAIVVASGKSVLDIEYGSVIDSFEVVLRFMSLKTAGNIIPFLGTKTDIFVFNLGIRGVEIFEQKVIEHTIPTKNILACGSCPAPNRLNRVLKAIEGKNYVLEAIHLEDVQRMKEALFLKNIFPSSGIMAVDYLLKRFDTVCVHGFDKLAYGLSGNDNFKKFYDDDKCYSKEYVLARHDYEREAIYLKALEQAGKVVQLSTLIQHNK